MTEEIQERLPSPTSLFSEVTSPWRRERGFTIVEMLLVLAILTLVGTLTLHFFSGWMPRQELRGSVSQARFLISKARLEAIQRGVCTVVRADLENGQLVAFADVNGDPVVGNPGYASYLVYDPDASAGEKQTDYEIGHVQLERSSFGAPESYGFVEGGVHAPGASAGEPTVLVFTPTGVPQATGAFRFADSGGRNFVEAAITSFAGKIEIRKFLKVEDSPSSTAGFFEEGWRQDGVNVWVWY